MKKVFVIIAFILSFFIVSFYLISVDQRKEIKLVDCIDGDTARFIIDGKEEKVRFLGIDTPEYTNMYEEFGKEASEYTCEALKNAKNIYIEYDINSDRYDKYNRVLGWIIVDNNNLSELLLSKGYAEVKYIYGNYKYVDDLCKAQNNAYKDRLGIWNNNYSEYMDNYCFNNGY